MKRSLLLLLTLLLLFALSACADTAGEEESWQDGIVDKEEQEETAPASIAISELALPLLSAQTLDPITCSDGVQQTVGSLLYEGLFELDEHFLPCGVLCSEYHYDRENLTYTFIVRTDAGFPDGSSLTANDVLATLRRAAASDRYRARFSSVTEMSAAGNTLTVRLSAPNSVFPALLDIPVVKSGTEQNDAPLGTGPYFFSGSDMLVANTNWWRGAPPLERIALISVKDNDTAAHLFSSYEVHLLCSDLTGSTPAPTSGSITCLEAPSCTMQYLGFNTAHPVLQNAELRSAMSELIPRSSICSVFLSGHGAPAQFPLSPAAAVYPLALEKSVSSAAYLTETEALGISVEKPVHLTLLVNEENSFKRSIAARLAEDLSVGGISVTLRALPWNEYLAALQSGNFDLYYGEVTLTADWNISPLLVSGGALNYGAFSDPELEAQLRVFLADECERTARNFYSAFAKKTPFAPIAFKSVSILFPSGLIDNMHPTALSPFAGLQELSFRFSPEK